MPRKENKFCNESNNAPLSRGIDFGGKWEIMLIK
jgi:hypothetical protein